MRHSLAHHFGSLADYKQLFEASLGYCVLGRYAGEFGAWLWGVYGVQ